MASTLCVTIIQRECSAHNVECIYLTTNLQCAIPAIFLSLPLSVCLSVSLSLSLSLSLCLCVYEIEGQGVTLTFDIGWSHPSVIICKNYDWLQSPMLHTKLYDNRPTGSGEEDFWMFFTLYGHGGHLGHVTWTREQTFLPLSHGCSTWNLTPNGLVASKEKMFENVDRRQTTDDDNRG